MDIARLAKLLNLTRSENDHEALSAIRAANKMVKRWEDALRNAPSGLDAWVAPSRASTNTWTMSEREMINICLLGSINIQHTNILTGMLSWLEQGHSLSSAQKHELLNIYRNLVT